MATIESKLTFQDQMSSKLDKLNKMLDKVNQTTEKSKQEMEDMTIAFGAGSKEAAKATMEWAKNQQELNALNKTIEVTKREQEEMARVERQAALEAAFQNQNTSILSKGIDGLKNIFSGVAGKIAASMKIVDIAVQGVLNGINKMKETVNQSIQDFSSFQSSLVDVNNLLDRSDVAYEQNKANLANASREAIRHGVSIETANKALFDSVSAIGDVDKALSTYKSSQILAKAGATDLATATNGLTNVMNAYGLSANEANDVSAAFFRAQVVGKTNVGELASAIGQVAPIAKSAGVGYQELLATMSVLTKGGLSTAESTTALRATLAALIKPSKDAAATLKQYGVPVGAAELQSKGLAYALDKLQKAAEANPDVMAEMIPNIRALTGASSLTADSLKLVDETIQQMNIDAKTGSGLMEAYNDKTNTLEQSQKDFIGANQDLALTIGSILEPIVRMFLGTLTNVINFINNAIIFVQEFSDIITVVLAGGIVFLIGKLIVMNAHLIFTRNTMLMVGNAAKIMWSAIISPIGIAIALGAILVTIFNKVFGITFQQNIKNAIISLHAVATACSNLITLFQNAGIAFSNIFKKEGEKKAFKSFKDNSIWANTERAEATMKKLNFGGKTGADNAFAIPKISGATGAGGLGGLGSGGSVPVTGKGGKPVNTKVEGEVAIREQDLELLHDLSTRDFAQYYQTLTPQVTIPGMVIHETADVNEVIGAVASTITGFVRSSTENTDYGNQDIALA